MNAESAPKGAQEIPAKASTDSLAVGTDFTAGARPCNCAALNFEDREAARLTGVEQGMGKQFRLDVTDAVHAALHALSLEALGMQRRSAIHGPAFSAMVTEAGERDD